MADDPHDLKRFVDTQDPIYTRVVSELRAGVKQSHWMWFIFPQLGGLGHSAMSRRYAIASPDEAKAYLAHPILGARLRECTALVLAAKGHTLAEIFGDPDDMKFCSSMTLFAHAAPDESLFRAALEKCFGSDDKTLRLLGAA
ncbi:MAG TPA: DUF1810 domain-containing protein [Rhizomicrobium sp.]|jgi:uncharacterized protein (DUF1810 family)|nr:DUF1810 domain-containing protein [Rhizomicrobium sp.]